MLDNNDMISKVIMMDDNKDDDHGDHDDVDNDDDDDDEDDNGGGSDDDDNDDDNTMMMMTVIIIMMMMTMIIMIKIMTLKGAVHCAANCLRYVRSWPGRSRVQITCNTSGAYHVHHDLCHAVRTDSLPIKIYRVEIAVILSSFYWLK